MHRALADSHAGPVADHGDYHVGQVLRTPDGAMYVIDFDGNPTLSPAERVQHRPAAYDVAGMLVSLENVGHVAQHYAPELSDDDVVAMITGFVFAGAETTRRQLTAGVELLAELPAEWDRLAAEPDLLPTAVDEILRLRGIVPGLTRRAEEPFAREDLAVDPGGRALLSFTAANRDPERFDAPAEFRPDRADAHAHVTFGWGPHLCVGAGLARLELAEGLRALTARFEPPVVLEAGPTSSFGTPDWLRVRLVPRSA